MCVCVRERRRARERETCCVVCLHLSFPFLIQLDCFFSDLIKNFLVREREGNGRGKQHVHGACDSVGAQDERLQRR